MQFCFAMEVQVSAKLILGNKNKPQRIEEGEQMLTSSDFSSLVIDNLCE